ncbi:hypothetical protein N658DRAFT_506628 [Parathielavia hyrcaniae]|uniref:Uncharacterized protein n=1 Tax=Parathielavia hyrcaniae TaxID=113614 RepID=A0AAN6Q303_9PEZI|nr:hypothetical protein N658DRAFT_506628 [Parathielavia hyrcaniae]
MGDSAEAQDGLTTDAAANLGFPVVDIETGGDLLLDVTFDTSRETLKAARKAATLRPTQKPEPAVLKSRTRVGYRVQLAVLKQNSRYFDNLLSDTRFAEARSIEDAFQKLSLRGLKPSEASASDLPVVKIHEDDEATQSAVQDAAFEDLLRILHRKQSTAKPATTHSLAVLAVLADRFACTATVSKYLAALKYKWPATQTLLRDDGRALSRAAEETLRQKILVFWLLDQPLKMQAATRELIMYGSRRWSASLNEEDESNNTTTTTAAWWDLPDGLETELHHRRACILRTIASIQRHFLSLYTSRSRQCKLGYESSASCDSYQLGEIVRFLTSRGLLFLTDFSDDAFSSSSSSDSHSMSPTSDKSSFATTDIGHLLATLKQVPAYQVDKHHTNCGLRTRVLPVLEFVQAMLAAGAVAVSRQAWVRDREGTSWVCDDEEEADRDAEAKKGKEKAKKVFRFTRGLATDQRLRYEGALAVDRMARALFTAEEWDWTAEEREDSRGVEHDTRRARVMLCENDSSAKPDLVSLHEGKFCDMKTREILPLCGSGVAQPGMYRLQARPAASRPTPPGKTPATT